MQASHRTPVIVVVVVGIIIPGLATGIPTVPGGEGPPDTSLGPEPSVHQSPSATCSIEGNYPESSEEFVQTFQSQNRPYFDEYNEFETIRSFAESKVQVGTFSDDERREMKLVLRLFDAFESSYLQAQNGSLEASLATSNRVERCIERLREMDVGYAELASIALDRFYERVGQRLLERANTEASTPEQLRYQRLAAEAFRRGGASQEFQEISLRLERDEAEFASDLEDMNRSEAQGQNFLTRCQRCDDPMGIVQTHGFDVFNLYEKSLSVQAGVSQAESLADKHSLSERRSRYESLGSRIETVRFNIAIAASMMILGYAAAIALIAGVVAHRISAWRETVEQSRVGDVVLMEGST